jgi:hypothetical protein
MKPLVVFFLTLASACTPAIPPPRPIIVAEGKRHVILLKSATIPASEEPEWYATAMQFEVPALRGAEGNVVVYILRKRHGSEVTMTIASEWKSSDDLQRCKRDGLCSASDEESEVLFEALR